MQTHAFLDFTLLRLSGWQSWVVGVWLFFLGSFSLRAQEVPAPPSEAPPTFAECRQRPQSARNFGKMTTYEVTVIFKSPQKDLTIISDGTENAVLTSIPKKSLARYRMGNRMKVTGYLRRESNRLDFFAKKMVKIGQGELRPPLEIPNNPNNEDLRKLHTDHIRLSGQILSVSQYSDQIRILIRGDNFRYLLRGPIMGSDEIFSRVGAKVTVDGLFWFPFDISTVDTPFEMPQLFFNNQNVVHISGNAPSNIEFIEGRTLKPFGDGLPYLQVAGRNKLVELRTPFRQRLVFHESFAKCWGKSRVTKTGEEVFNVTGFRLVDLEDLATEKDVTSSAPQRSIPLTPYLPGDRNQNLQKVAVLGKWASETQADLEKGYFTLTTEKEGADLRVVLPNSVTLIDKGLLNAQRLNVTGYLHLGGEMPEIYPQSFRAIEVIAKTPWMETAAFRWLAFGVLGIALGAFIWAASLKRIVKHRTKALDSSLGLLNASYDAIDEGICVIGCEGAIRKTNPRFWEVLGLQVNDLENLNGDRLGEKISQCFDKPRQFLDLWSRLSNDREVREKGNLEITCNPGGEVNFYTVPAAVSPTHNQLGRVWVFKDMTEQRRLESTLVQSQKMEAVGRLAGGVAHDFNNLLTGILGNLDVARLDPVVARGPLAQPIDAAEQAAKRATKLVKGLLGFSRQEKLKASPNCVNATVRQLVSLMRPTLSRNIVLQTNLDDELNLARFDPTQLEQVILNMVVNARDELDSTGGEITITTQSVKTQHPETLVPGRYTCISVADNGGGMSENTRKQIFEPYFTTKEPGKGTGLGLSTSYGIVKQMDGWIECESQLKKGTVFRVYLNELEASDKPRATSKPEPPQKTYSKSNRAAVEVLCVDDEDVVREVMLGVLARAGFSTCSAEHGREALEILAKRIANGEKLPDIILSDLTMPVMDGRELLTKLRLTYPDMLVIICSGYFPDMDEFVENTETRLDGFIEKPFEASQIVNEVERLLETRQLQVTVEA